MPTTQRPLPTAADWDDPDGVGVRGLHTVGMMAAVLDVPPTAVRHWVRGGLLRPSRRAGRIEWFSYGELVVGQRLARLLKGGFRLREIDARLANLIPGGAAAAARHGERIVADGRRLSFRRGLELLGAGGQRQFSFYTVDLSHAPDNAQDNVPAWRAPAVPISHAPRAAGPRPLSPQGKTGLPSSNDGDDEPVSGVELLALAADLEAAGDLEAATEALRALLQADGPSAQVSFVLAELLYRSGDLTAARERYYVAIEFDADHLEARTSLGCVLAELGDQELALAAFEGVLRQQPDYADAHWHIAGVLDDIGRRADAARHLRTFLALAPDSPWVDLARSQLSDR
ncbi:MAG: MerR family transcriptional regulator [Planctomycetota bacterium]|nr:MAG: MerR family transcriptional regulator [Planctomycetota bacterium]